MRRLLLPVLLLLTLPTVAQEEEGEAYFSLTSSQSFGPADLAKVSVSASGTRTLEFRMYRVNDPVKFFAERLEDAHRFGGRAPREPKELTALERFYSWKRRWRFRMRDTFTRQLQSESRNRLRESFSPSPKKEEGSPGVAPASLATQFAAVPVLNQQQLVARWPYSSGTKESYYTEAMALPQHGPGLYLVEATNGKEQAYTIVSITNLAIVAKGAPGRVIARVVDRETGAPKTGVEVVVLSKDRKKRYGEGRTNAQGVVEAAVVEEQLENVMVLAKDGAQFAVASIYGYNIARGERNSLTAYIYTDRPVYRPGHEVKYKVLMRSRGDRGWQLPSAKQIPVEVHDEEDKIVHRTTLSLSSYGTANGRFTLPDTAGLGYYNIMVRLDDGAMAGGFNVEEYKKPEYEVKVTPAAKRVLQGQPTSATIEAKFYFGEPVANAKVAYTVHQSPYWPPYADEPEEGDEGYGDYYGEQLSEESGQLDKDGRLTMTIPTKLGKRDVRLRIEAKVTDESGREIAGSGSVVNTVGSFYLVARPSKYVYAPGEATAIEVEARDYDGNPVANAGFQVELSEYRYDRRNQFQPFAKAEGRTDSQGRGRVEMPGKSGSLLARVSARTPEGRTVTDDAFIWVSGAYSYAGTDQRLTVVPDKKSYAAGETARILVTGAPANSNLWIGVEGKSIRSHQFIASKDGSTTIDVPVTADMAPNFYLSASTVSKGKLFSTSKAVKVPPVQQTLQVQVEASKPQFQPGEKGEYTITAKDHAGRPVQAEFSLGVVDEAIYAIRKEPMPELTSFFYGRDYNRVNLESSLNYYFTGEAGKRRMQLAKIRPWATNAQLKPERFVEAKVRKAFPDTMFWIADLRTDAAGRARVQVEYPDALTLWRATARGLTTDTKVGGAVQRAVVRKNLITRLGAPRFLRDGDEVALTVIAQNYLPQEKTVRMVLEAQGVELLDPAQKDVTVPSRGIATMTVRVKPRPGAEAVFVSKALTNEESDAMEIRLPIVPLGVKVAEAKAGAGSAETSLSFANDAIGHSKSLQITVAPSVAGSIFAALEYLTSFPYGCTEQTMSSFLPNVLVSQSVQTLGLKTNIDKAQLEKMVRAGLERLQDYQHEDGGWGWWKTDESQVFMTAYVVSGLAQAKAAGYSIPEEVVANGAAWLEKNADPKLTADLRAYAAYSLALAGRKPVLAIDQSKLSAYGLSLYGLALDARNDAKAADVARQLESRAQQSDTEAWWKSDRDTLMEFEIDATPESTAYAMKLLSRRAPQSPLLPKAALYLVNHRSEGYWWSSTKQTAMVIYGLMDYLKQSGELKPNSSVKVEVDGRPVLERQFTETDAAATQTIRVPAAQLPGSRHNVKVTMSGQGRVYWSARAEAYVPAAQMSRTGSVALNVVREYFKLVPDKVEERIVYRLQPLSGPVANGDLLASRVTVSGGEWKYLLVEDPIPSGAEIVNADQAYEIVDKPDWWGWGFARREFRDDRAAYFETYFNGQERYFSLMKVTNAGKFGISPAKAEPMYQPGKLATSATANIEAAQ